MIHVLARQIHLPLPYLVLELAYHTPAHHRTQAFQYVKPCDVNSYQHYYEVALYLSPALFLEKMLPNLYFLVGSVSMSS